MNRAYDKQTKKVITVLNKVNSNLLPELNQPVVASSVKVHGFCCCKQLPINATISILKGTRINNCYMCTLMVHTFFVHTKKVVHINIYQYVSIELQCIIKCVLYCIFNNVRPCIFISNIYANQHTYKSKASIVPYSILSVLFH